MAGIWFEVKVIIIKRKDNQLHVQTDSTEFFELTPHSRLGEIRLKPRLSIPRITKEARESGVQYFVFYPRSKEPLDKIRQCDVLQLTGYNSSPSGPLE